VDNFQPGGEFLASTDVVDWFHADVRAVAWFLGGGTKDPIEIARRSFEWVRDEIEHCSDFGRSEVTCKASEVLTARTGFCYAKSHLLAALLRANKIPAGFCYQRLSIGGCQAPFFLAAHEEPERAVGKKVPDAFALHGLNAVWLPEIGWYRVDPRGNRPPRGHEPAIDAEFDPPRERLAFAAELPGEATLPDIRAEPLPVVVSTLRRHATAAEVAANLPDICLVGGS
jgi:transglutaminase-like putative cysteine protease